MLRAAATSVADGLRPEMELLLCCARARRDEESISQTKALLPQVEDWDYLLEQALRHKIMPLVYRHINSFFSETAPAGFMECLRDYFYLNAARNHFLTEELGRVLEDLAKGGIPCVPYKGPALAIELYGDAAYRQFSDLDIFLRREDVARAGEILRHSGYKREQELNPAEERAFLEVDCQFMFVRETERLYLELHWGFVPTYFPLALDSEAMWGRLQPFTIGGADSLSFSPEDLLLILSVNAGKDLWRELGPLHDVAELVRVRKHLDWERVRIEAKRAGTRRMLHVTLLLARDLLGAPIPQGPAREAEADRKAVSLASAIGRKFLMVPKRPGRISRYLAPAQALDGPWDRLRFHLRLALRPTHEDWAFIKLPPPLRGLYYLTRPVRLASKYLVR